MEVAQAIDASQVIEKWEGYFERAVAGIADEAAINEMREELVAESCLLEMEDVADTERHRRLVVMAKRLLGGYQQSAVVAQTVVSGLIRPTALPSASLRHPPYQSACRAVRSGWLLFWPDDLPTSDEGIQRRRQRCRQHQAMRKPA